MVLSNPPQKSLAVHDEHSVNNGEKSPEATNTDYVFRAFEGDEVTDAMLQEAASLFNKYYGVWGPHPMGCAQGVPKRGSRVKLSKDRLRAQCLPENVDCCYVRVAVEGRLAGNAFACRWMAGDKIICWITQLVVHSDYRHRGLAVCLLNLVRRGDDDIYGLMSSHPAACLAAAKAFTSGIASVSTRYIAENAINVLKQSPIAYIKTAEPRGSLFQSDDESGSISSVFTNFFVDHAEPLEALRCAKQRLEWPLGELLHGHEFFLMIWAQPRTQSPSQSPPRPVI